MKIVKIQPTLASKVKTNDMQVAVNKLTEKVCSSKKKLISRKIPNSVGVDSDYYPSKNVITNRNIKFLPTDEEKMNSMSESEKKAYIAYLILKGDYITL